VLTLRLPHKPLAIRNRLAKAGLIERMLACQPDERIIEPPQANVVPLRSADSLMKRKLPPDQPMMIVHDLDRLTRELNAAELATYAAWAARARIILKEREKLLNKLMRDSNRARATLRKQGRIGHAAAAAVATPSKKKGQKEEEIAELAKKHKVSERYIWRAIRFVRRRSPAEYFLINALRHGAQPRSAVIAAAKAAGIATRTLERTYRKYGASSPGRRLRMWDLAHWAKKRS
jgi:hypothetical protein